MARADVRPMTVQDYVQSRLDGADGPNADRQALTATGAVYLEGGPCYAGFLNGKLLGVAGIRLLWAGVGEAWAVPTEAGREHGRAYHRAVRDGYRQIVAQFHLRRVHAWVPADFWVGMRWAMALGFMPETAPLKGFGPQGQDFVLVVQFPNGKERV